MPTPSEPTREADRPRSAIELAMLEFGGSLRDALRTLFGEERPAAGELVGRLGISRTLAWRLQQMVKPDDLAANLNAIVAERGFRVLLASLDEAGLSGAHLAEVESRWGVLRRSTGRQRVDRDGLRTIGAQARSSSRTAADAARRRRDVMRANEILWGIGLRTTVFTQMFAPPPREAAMSAPASDRIGIAASILHHGLRVLRPIPPLVVYHRLLRTGPGGQRPPHLVGAATPPWIEEVCTPGLCGSAVQPIVGRHEAIGLDPAAIPTTTPIDLAFAESARDFASPYAESPGQSGFMETPLGFPVERVVVFLGTHESMPAWSDHECVVRTSKMTSRRLPPERRLATLPIDLAIESVESIDGVPEMPRGSERVAPAMRRIVSINASALGHEPSAFRFRRVVLDHPPMPSFLLLRWRLAEHPS